MEINKDIPKENTQSLYILNLIQEGKQRLKISKRRENLYKEKREEFRGPDWGLLTQKQTRSGIFHLTGKRHI